MALLLKVTAETINDCEDLEIFDESEYNISDPKTNYSTRNIILTKADATTETVSFPYTNTDNSIIDSKVITGYFTKDLYISIEVEFVRTNTTIETFEFNYISICNAVNMRKEVVLDLNTSCNCCEDASKSLCVIDTTIESALYAASISEGEKAQVFLDKLDDISSTLNNNCNCN